MHCIVGHNMHDSNRLAIWYFKCLLCKMLDVQLIFFPQGNDARMIFEDRGMKTRPIYEKAFPNFMHCALAV